MLLFGNHTKCFVHVLKASAASFAKKIDLTPKKKKHLKAILMTRQELTWGEKVTSISR